MTEESAATPRRPILRRVLKWTGIGLATIIVLIIVAIIVIPHVVNTAFVKHKIEQVAQEKTGRQVTIAGPLSLSLFPWVGFDAHNVTMANAAGFGEKPFMHVKEAKIHAKLLPLIFKHVEVSGITFDTPTINLARNKDGKSNWQDLAGGKKTATGKPKKTGPLANLSVGRIAISNGTLDYNDAASGKHYTIKQFGLKANNLAPGRFFPLALNMRLASTAPHLNAKILLDTQAEFDQTGKELTLGRGTLGATLSGFGGNKPLTLAANWNRIALNANAGTANVAGLALALAGLKAKLDASARDLNGSPAVSGHLDVPPFSPRKFLAALGDPLPTSLKGFNRASLSADLSAGKNSLSLNNLKLALDHTALTGSLGVPALDRGALRFRLAADKIDLDNYLVTGSGAKTRIGAAHGKNFMETRLPGRLLKKLDLAGRLSIGRLSGFGLEASDLALNLNAADGTLHADPIQAKLYSGSYSGAITLAAAGQGVSLVTEQTLQNVDVGGLIGALSGQQRLSGVGNMKTSLKGEGDTVGELLNTLTGNASLSLQHGAIDGIDLWDSLRRAWLLVKEHKRSPPAAGPKRTQITNLKAHATINRGKVTNDVLVAELPFLSVTGHGTIDLNRDEVDYDLLATVIKTPTAEGKSVAELKGLEVPISISGSLSDFSAAPDIKKALEARVKAAARRKLEQEKKKLKDKLLKELTGGGGG